ncbi:uncharacterized protein LOC132034942 [Lycium ferocissimum]|uniref:uncharacterized protein LOC132034942 n=1 Tax=Lycium ferocissimum TaxID=112874 RepID=UPI0028159C83|nr:uncharacterized protein LOC132034942 [Lycium ferocissimum]
MAVNDANTVHNNNRDVSNIQTQETTQSEDQGSENYSLWSKSMKLVWRGKNKLGFVFGTCKKEMYDSSLHELWDRCDAIVLALIVNTVSKDLISTVIYASNAYKVWEDLKERFNKVNTSTTYHLHREIATVTQGVDSVSVYFSKLKAPRDEFEALMPPPSYACSESK